MARFTKGQRVEVIAGDYFGERGIVVAVWYSHGSAPSGRWWGRRYLVAALDLDSGASLTIRVGMLKREE